MCRAQFAPNGDLKMHMGNSVVTDEQFGHLFLMCIKDDALQEVTYRVIQKDITL